MVSDYYSGYIEILNLPVTSTAQRVKQLNATFAHYEITKTVVSDNGYPFTGTEIKQKFRELNF